MLVITDTEIHLKLHEIVQWWYNGHEIYEITVDYIMVLEYLHWMYLYYKLVWINGPVMVNMYSDQKCTVVIAKLYNAMVLW